MKNKRVFIYLIVFMIVIIPNIVFANEIDEGVNDFISEAYKAWNNLSDEEKGKVIKPREEFVSLGAYLKENETKLGQSTNLPTYYNLQDHITLKAENQGSTNWCWAFAALKALESNISIKNNENYNFSEAHLAFMRIKSLNGWDDYDTNEAVSEGGRFEDLLRYNGNYEGYTTKGPVYESSVPNKTNFSSSEFEQFYNQNVLYEILETEEFPTLSISADQKKDNFSEEQLSQLRKLVKQHIIENGGIYTGVYVGKNETQNKTSNFDNVNGTEAVCVKEQTGGLVQGHAVLIIGWDDNYSKENFAEGIHKPDNDGAYICLNSYGEDYGKNGTFYVSYEDIFIESEMMGVVSAQKYEDKDGPNVIFNKDGNDITIDVIDICGVGANHEKTKYVWTDSYKVPADNEFINQYTNNSKIPLENDKYLWIYTEDTKGNVLKSGVVNKYFEDKTLYSNIIEKMGANILEYDNQNQKILISNFQCRDTAWLQNSGIKSLDGLEIFYNLRSLYTNSGVLEDVDAIKELKNLRLLSLYSANIKDIEFLRNLTKLYYLNLYNCKIENIEPLANLDKLKWLNVCNNYISDFSIMENKDIFITDYRYQKIFVKVESSTETNKEVQIPIAFQQALDKNSEFYTTQKFAIANATLNGMKITMDATSNDSIPIMQIRDGELKGTFAFFVVTFAKDTVIKIEKTNTDSWAKKHEMKVDVIPNKNASVQNNDFFAVWSTSNEQPANLERAYTNGTKILTPTNQSGKYYLWVLANTYEKFSIKVNDYTYEYENVVPKYQVSEQVCVDIEIPKAPIITASVQNGSLTKTAVTAKIEGEETYSGIKKYQYSFDNGRTWQDLDKGKEVVISKQGKTEMIARTVNNAGTEGSISETYSVSIKGEIETGTIRYSTVEMTNKDVVATIEFKDSKIKVTNNNGEKQYTFTKNGSFTFKFENEDGIKGELTATVKNIDKVVPKAEIEYSTTVKTNKSVVATIKFKEDDVQILNNDGLSQYTFLENGYFKFEFVDKAGNQGSAVARVSNINKDTSNKNNNYSTNNNDFTVNNNKNTIVNLKGQENTVNKNSTWSGGVLPKAGGKSIILILIVSISVFSILIYKKYKNIYK